MPDNHNNQPPGGGRAMSDNPRPGGELKACPFCGGAAHEQPGIYSFSAWIGCGNPHCFMSPSSQFHSDAEALAAWNHRAEGNGPVALDSPEAERRRQEPAYKLIQRVDQFLHDAMEVPSLKDRAAEMHAEIHEAAFEYVTQARAALQHKEPTRDS